MLTYRAQSALAAAGLAASVEVRDRADPDTAYHRCLDAARPLPGGRAGGRRAGAGPAGRPAAQWGDDRGQVRSGCGWVRAPEGLRRRRGILRG
ncbi:hypothetical protein HBB16_12220 [Pseudonocardia sp. MCCB 268]|nr:hypothetical protein [Pseudonocardia cytotoxica]